MRVCLVLSQPSPARISQGNHSRCKLLLEKQWFLFIVVKHQRERTFSWPERSSRRATLWGSVGGPRWRTACARCGRAGGGLPGPSSLSRGSPESPGPRTRAPTRGWPGAPCRPSACPRGRRPPPALETKVGRRRRCSGIVKGLASTACCRH